MARRIAVNLIPGGLLAIPLSGRNLVSLPKIATKKRSLENAVQTAAGGAIQVNPVNLSRATPASPGPHQSIFGGGWSRPDNNASAKPAPPASNTARHGWRRTMSLARTAFLPHPSIACAVTLVAVVSARASLRLRFNAVLNADTFLRACCVSFCECSARCSIDARVLSGIAANAFAEP